MDRIITFENDNGLQCSVFKSGRKYVASLSDGCHFRGQGYFETFARAVSVAEAWFSADEKSYSREV
jgi:hypothetical protein